MKIIYPKRCPKCGQYNLSMAVSVRRFGKKRFLVCDTPGCWYFGPEARTNTGAIKKWNKETEKHGNEY